MFKLLSFPLCFLLPAAAVNAGGYGFDAVIPPAQYAGQLSDAGLMGTQGAWMRVRGLMDHERVKESEQRTVAVDRAGLLALRQRGIKTAVFLRWSPDSWKAGARPGGGHRMPLDLREAYERGRWLGATYGDLVDVWEIDNEPDIDFGPDNPETYAAFLKAVYLGLKAAQPPSGSKVEGRKAQVLGARWKVSDWRYHKTGFLGLTLDVGPSTFDSPPASRVVMAPLALPPGPYLERLWANGLASYTDGFNFHFYGYAEDFTGVYRQFESAVNELSADSMVAGRRSNVGTCAQGAPHSTLDFKTWDLRPRWTVAGLDLASSRADGAASREVRPYSEKPLPIFITEYGYGLLDADARDTVEGRVRQWRWFASLAKQIRTLRPEGPMAFLLNPYYEADLNEFGLLATSNQRLETGDQGVGPDLASGRADGAASRKVRPYIEASGDRQPATSSYTPSDFGQRSARPWMRRIGQRVGEAYASPALAYLWDYAERHPYRARDWSVRAAPPSPVVIDWVAGTDLVQVKRSGGYVLTGASAEWTPVPVNTGRGRLVLYNFGPGPVAGELVITDPSVVAGLPAAAITLAPGERREMPVELRISGEAWAPRTLGVRFLPTTSTVSLAVFSTRLFPNTAGMAVAPVAEFAFAPEATRARQAALQARPLATGEPGLRPDGRWLVTDGVRVEERDGVWRFHIDCLPAEPLRPAAVELPLPAGFVFKSGTALMLERRRAISHSEFKLKVEDEVDARVSARSPLDLELKPSTPAARRKPRAGMAGDMMDVYFRTENGNLYQTWPRLRVGAEWAGYLGQADDFTMGFFGRAELPWRFAENRPASLVFFLRPSQVPAVFEVRNARIVRLGGGG